MNDHDDVHEHDVHEHDLGLQHDLATLRRRGLGRSGLGRSGLGGTGLGRRGLLGLVGGVGALTLAGCAGDEPSASSSPTRPEGAAAGRTGPEAGAGGEAGTGADIADVADGEIPEETAGPYPGDGSNGPNVLTQEGVVRSDLTSSFGTADGVAEGVPLTLRFRVYDLTGDEIELLPGAAVYAWHCDRDGAYSMYDGDAASQNYLRGVQIADDDGRLEFTTIFPGCYPGRWPHVHFEVYRSVEEATSAENKLRTSQLAFPAEACEEVYATSGYEESLANLASVSLDSDGIFSDGHSLQLATMSGSPGDGLLANLNVPI